MADRPVIEAIRKGYWVTDDGKVLSKRGRQRKLYLHRNGYFYFSIATDKGSRGVPVHVLVAVIKYGHEAVFRPGIQVRHLDNNAQNNAFINIAIGTATQNQQDIPAERRGARIRKAYNTRGRGTRYKLSVEQVLCLREMHDKGTLKGQISSIAQLWGVQRNTISAAAKGKTNKLVGANNG